MNGSNQYVAGTGTTHFMSIDAATGKVTATKEWLGPDSPSLTATPTGNFLLEDAGQLVLYSSSLQVVNSVRIEKQTEGRYEPFLYAVSTDGNSVLVQRGNNNPYTLTMFDPETLRPIRSWSSDFPVSALSGRHFARWDDGSLYVKEERTEWKEIYKELECSERLRSADFLMENLLASRSCNKLTLIDTDGSVLFSKRFAPKYKLDDFSASANGQRFEISIVELKKDPWWTGDPGYERIHRTLIVYDTESHQALSNFVLGQNYDQSFSCAFSADGSQLALLRSGVLELYRIGATH
jgi:DNA-binding beta-propeller fold protein YncE